ncbi:hypothetical protein Pcinc_029124 [Petrolisthes cinctipes]|uniref:Uncharacterized protein n=1 Tax=Petrolisthes cinctipes TaxID=88211 RepID=A0AAE1F0Y9_PETCI|nr:hypothetical protein Pcinc_029124 [Petrolisthes cinctipes]
MQRKTVQQEDSGSDWDSMSEMDPPVRNQRTESERPVPVPQKIKSMTYIDPQLENAQARDNPPYNFKPEVTSPIRSSRDSTVKPGKGRKGRTYDPQTNSTKHVSFVGEANDTGIIMQGGKKSVNGDMERPDSDSEDPLYSTVKPKSVRHQPPLPEQGTNTRHQQPSPEQTTNHTNKPSKKLPKLKFSSSKKKLEGVDNVAYEDDISGMKPDMTAHSNMNLNSSNISTQQVHTKTSHHLPVSVPQFTREEEQMMTDYEAHIMHNNENWNSVRRECTPPLIMAAGEASLNSFVKSSMIAVNRAIGESFAIITFPFTCIALFIHHFLRFLLQGLLKPLFVDSMTLVVEYLIRPMVAGVIKPLLGSIHVAVTSLSDTLLVCVRPLTAVLGSLRLVEVNYTRRYSVDEI